MGERRVDVDKPASNAVEQKNEIVEHRGLRPMTRYQYHQFLAECCTGS